MHSVSNNGVTVTENFYKGALIEYKVSGGNLSEVRIGETDSGGKVDANGALINIAKLPSGQLLDGNALVYVDDDGTYSVGSIKDLLDKDLTITFHYIKGNTTADQRVKALIVDTENTGAQSIFVMINSISQGWNDGTISVISGIEFASGANATAKTWNYTNYDLGTAGRYERMVKFSLGEDGVLKAIKYVDELFDDVVVKNGNADQGENPTITGAALDFNNPWAVGDGGTFVLNVTSGTYKDGAAFTPGYIAFAANTVLYKKDGPVWAAYRPTDGNFKADMDKTDANSANWTRGNYIFLQTDPSKKVYNVIIKTN
jgi:hypothetical protein